MFPVNTSGRHELNSAIRFARKETLVRLQSYLKSLISQQSISLGDILRLANNSYIYGDSNCTITSDLEVIQITKSYLVIQLNYIGVHIVSVKH